MPRNLDKKMFDEETLISMLFDDQHEELAEAFWKMASTGQDYGINALGKSMFPIVKKTPWLQPYSQAELDKLKKFSKEKAEKTALISQAHHALGLMPRFIPPGQHKTENYEYCVQDAFASSETYKNTLYERYRKQQKSISFTRGFHNTQFQESLIDSLEKFINQKKSNGKNSETEMNALDNALACMKSSVQYYKKEFSPKKIRNDLNTGKMITFSTGRHDKTDFHAINIVIKGDKLAICDRFDTGKIEKYETQPYGMGSVQVKTLDIDTERDTSKGAFVYQLKKPFKDFTKEQQDRLITWVTTEITLKDSAQGFKTKLPVSSGKPIASLNGKQQTKGNCRYASKKATVGALIYLGLEDSGLSTKEKEDCANQLQKEFTRFDRLNKIDSIINSSLLRQEEKNELLLLTLLRNNDPKNATDQAIYEKIIGYYKQNANIAGKIEDLLFPILERMEQKIESFKNDNNKKDSLTSRNNVILMLAKNGVEYKPTSLSQDASASENRTLHR